MGKCNVSVSREWDGHGRSVGRSVDARVPLDHASVGLAQARPNYFHVYLAVCIKKDNEQASMILSSHLNELGSDNFLKC